MSGVTGGAMLAGLLVLAVGAAEEPRVHTVFCAECTNNFDYKYAATAHRHFRSHASAAWCEPAVAQLGLPGRGHHGCLGRRVGGCAAANHGVS